MVITPESIITQLEKFKPYTKLSSNIKNQFQTCLLKDFSEASERGLFFRNAFKEILNKHPAYPHQGRIWAQHKVFEETVQLFIKSQFKARHALSLKLTDDISRQIIKELFTILAPTLRAVYETQGDYPISMESFFKKYKTLYNKVIYSLGCQCEYIDNAFLRFEQDKSAIEKKFRRKYSGINEIRTLDSDPHNGQTRVLCFVFNNGLKLAYKPRSLAGESYLNDVLRCMGNTIPVSPIMVLDKKDYGWMEWVKPAKFYDSEKAAFSIGGLLAICCTIGLTDIHAENLILSKSGITVIDAEAIGLLHPDVTMNNSMRHPNVVDTLILPAPEGNSAIKWWDISVLGYTCGIETIPIGIKYFKNGRSPKLIYHHLQKKYGHLSKCIAINSTELTIQKIISGFHVAYNQLSQIGSLQPVSWNRFRFIYRPTSVYLRSLVRLTDSLYSLNEETAIKELLPYINDLVTHTTKNNDFIPCEIISRELTSLVHGDVPRLTGEILQTTLNDKSEILCWNLPEPVFSTRIIDMACRLRKDNTAAAYITPVLFQFSGIEKVTQELGVFIERNLVYNESELCFYGLRPGKNNGIPKISKLDFDLYNGLAGIYLIVAVLEHLNSNTYGNLLTQLERSFKKASSYDFISHRPQSMSQGTIGLLYTYSFLYKIGIKRQHYAALIADYLNLLPDKPNKVFDKNFDIVTGMAGCLLIFEALPPVYNSGKIRRYKSFLVKALIRAQSSSGCWTSLGIKGLCGFSHGAAGVRFALKLYTFNHREKIIGLSECTEQALNFEDQNYENGNWRDLRIEDPGNQITKFSAWCHGAAGIALSEQHLINLKLSDRHDRVQAAFSPQLINQNVNKRGSICCGLGSLFELNYEGFGNINSQLLIKAAIEEVPPVCDDNNFPTSLFRSTYGVVFLSILKQNFANCPNLLLLQ